MPNYTNITECRVCGNEHLDLKILLLTFIVILKREGISPNGSEIMPEFNPKRID